MDYVMTTIAWEFDIRDLKKLSLNGITYSSMSDEKKKYLKEVIFPQKWNEFIQYLIEKF